MSGSFTSAKRALGSYWIRGLVGLGVGVDALEESGISYPCRESKHDSSVQPVAKSLPTEPSRFVRSVGGTGGTVTVTRANN